MSTAQDRYEQLLGRIREYPSALVAFSGGLDSGFLLYAARAAFEGRRPLLAVLALSPAVPVWDREDATRIAREIGAPLRTLETDLLAQPRYTENNPLRCYYCKTDLYIRLEVIRRAEGFAVIFNGTQADDPGDFRPGLRAAEEFRIASPLLGAGLTKEEIRALARRSGLSFWDKPSSPCLASRIPHGTPVTLEALTQVHRAESALRALGLRVVRVRHHGTTARVELGDEDFEHWSPEPLRSQMEAALLSVGYSEVALGRYEPSGRALVADTDSTSELWESGHTPSPSPLPQWGGDCITR